MWLSEPMQPRREQILTVPPPRTIMDTIGALQLEHSHEPTSAAWQCGQKNWTIESSGISCSEKTLYLPYNEDSRSQPCLSPKDAVTRIEG
jgi:hypothetical protein